MAKEKEPAKHESGAKPKRKHLHEIRTVQARDGSLVHHHTYKAQPDDQMTEPEREHMATSDDAEGAGQHVAEQFGMNQMANAEPEPGAAEPAQGEPVEQA